MIITNPAEYIVTKWGEVAPTGFGGNAHPLVQREFVDPDGRRLISYPALVFFSQGVGTVELTPDGRRNVMSEQFQLDFRATTYSQARHLAGAYRQATEDVAVDWAILPDDIGLELILREGGDTVPRRVAIITLPYKPAFG